jgi:molecular chaperone GrpE (heat shock protein)
MDESVKKLKNIVIKNLKKTNELKNEVGQIKNEKHDQLKDISKGIIDVLDSFKRVEERVLKKGYNEVEEAEKTMNRYKSVEKKLLILLRKHGITKIEFPDKKLIFGLCEVVETKEAKDREDDEIISIVKNGYIRGKEVIRPAQIIVVKN